MNENLLKLFKNIYEKQNELSNLTDSSIFSNYSNSEVHAIDIIGNSKLVNGVKISEELNLTRGAVSKIMNKLKTKELVEIYKVKDNKKEIYYKLTLKGKDIFYSHKKAHADWENRELKFFNSIPIAEKEIIEEFLENYNNYLGNLIIERTKKWL